MLYKDLACLVHLKALTLKKINLVTQISKSFVCTHLEPWRLLDMAMLETTAPWEDFSLDTGAAKLKRAAQVAAIEYRDINRVTWRAVRHRPGEAAQAQ